MYCEAGTETLHITETNFCSGSWSPASHQWGPGSILGHSMQVL